MKITREMKQRGIIMFGGGLNRKAWMALSRAEGYQVRYKGTYAELWR